MNLPVQRFSSDVLSSFNNARRFLSGETTIAEITSKQHTHGPGTSCIPRQPVLATHWKVLHIITAPLRLITALFLTTVSVLIPTVYPLAQRVAMGYNVYDQQPTTVTLLKKTINQPQKGMEDITAHPPIAVSSLTDPRMKKRTFDEPCITFDHHNKGICRGMSDWFNYLYLQTQHLFEHPRDHMIALGNVFIKGGPREAVLLQSLHINKGKLLNVRMGSLQYKKQFVAPYVIALKPSLNGTGLAVANYNRAIKTIENLPLGSYRLLVPKHACAFIKVSPYLSYFFDPNFGVLEIAGIKQAAKLLPFFELYYKSKQKGVVAFAPVYQRPIRHMDTIFARFRDVLKTIFS